jgi:gamma-glutamylcyclotransferase (GGCT)/AIG2-like uncharacterized protein YtfP
MAAATLRADKLGAHEAWIKKGCDCYVVRRGEEIVGLLEKYRGRGHPWKVFAGYGHDARLVAFTDNGKAAAVALLEHEVGKMTHMVFVYGTLRRGEGNNRLLRDSRYVGDATVSGTLYSLGGFPGLRLDDAEGPVAGELWMVDDKTLADLDRLEGVAHGFYVRRRARAIGANARAVAWVYEIAEEHIVGRPVIASGDWRQRERATA